VTRRTELLRRAADRYEQAGDTASAVRCLLRAGAPREAALARCRAGDLPGAAAQFAAAGLYRPAAGCYRRAGLVEAAARCLEAAGDPLGGGFLLLTAEPSAGSGGGSAGGIRLRLARRLLGAATAPAPGWRLRRDVALGLLAELADGHGAAGPLRAPVETLAAALPALSNYERKQCVQWAVRATIAAGRHDLGAHVFAAAYAGHLPGAARQWRAWGERYLGDATGIPRE